MLFHFFVDGHVNNNGTIVHHLNIVHGTNVYTRKTHIVANLQSIYIVKYGIDGKFFHKQTLTIADKVCGNYQQYGTEHNEYAQF